MITYEEFTEGHGTPFNCPFVANEKILRKAYELYVAEESATWEERKVVMYGKPKAWLRHMSYRISGLYVPNTNIKNIIESYFIEELGTEFSIIQKEIIFKIDSYRPIPKGLSKPLALLYEAKFIQPVSAPDVDNYAKLIMDAINARVYYDDAQIICLRSDKFMSFTPRVEIFMRYKI